MQPIKRKSANLDVSLGEAFERFYPAVFRYFRYHGADAETANDLASSTFERALENLSRFDPGKSQIQTWLFVIAHNLAVNHWKVESTHPTTSLEDLDLPGPGEPLPEEMLINFQDRQEILKALQCLDPRVVEIIALKFGGRLTNRQIAGLIDLSESNIGVILFRSLLKLRSLLASAEAEVFHER